VQLLNLKRNSIFIKNKILSSIARPGSNEFHTSKGCFLKFGVEVGVEEPIVNEPLVLKTLIFQIAD
jgi:hypothetical protein